MWQCCRAFMRRRAKCCRRAVGEWSSRAATFCGQSEQPTARETAARSLCPRRAETTILEGESAGSLNPSLSGETEWRDSAEGSAATVWANNCYQNCRIWNTWTDPVSLLITMQKHRISSWIEPDPTETLWQIRRIRKNECWSPEHLQIYSVKFPCSTSPR